MSYNPKNYIDIRIYTLVLIKALLDQQAISLSSIPSTLDYSETPPIAAFHFSTQKNSPVEEFFSTATFGYSIERSVC